VALSTARSKILQEAYLFFSASLRLSASHLFQAIDGPDDAFLHQRSAEVEDVTIMFQDNFVDRFQILSCYADCMVVPKRGSGNITLPLSARVYQ
jgi:hypothetical protein